MRDQLADVEYHIEGSPVCVQVFELVLIVWMASLISTANFLADCANFVLPMRSTHQSCARVAHSTIINHYRCHILPPTYWLALRPFPSSMLNLL